MIQSMTGYGCFELKNRNLVITCELKSINNRYFDCSINMPSYLNQYESVYRKILKQYCVRGKLSVFMKIDLLDDSMLNITLNKPRLRQLNNVIIDLKKEINYNDKLLLDTILKTPEILNYNVKKIPSKLKNISIKVLKGAIKELISHRQHEGLSIEYDILKNIKNIKQDMNKLTKISKFDMKQLLLNYKKKIENNFNIGKIDEDRLILELSIFIDKKNINEEIVRVNSHLVLLGKLIGSKKFIGKKINFLLQELNREVNTISAKTDITKVNHLVVNIKDKIENIREQVQNIL